MAAVYGAALTLLREDVEFSDERRRALLNMIAEQATRLTRITEEILLTSKLDRDEVTVEQEPVDVADVVHATVEAVRSQEDEPPTIETDVAPDVGSASGDRSRIQQVLVNLIDNAVKYSPSGGEVSVSTVASSEGVRVEVRDQGIGIPPAEQTSIFEKFYRGSLEGEQVRAGTGLGLYICRELVQRMGGTIGVESDPGSGSTFYFELPRAA